MRHLDCSVFPYHCRSSGFREAHHDERAVAVCTAWQTCARELSDREAEARASSALAASHRQLQQWQPALTAANRAVRLAEE